MIFRRSGQSILFYMLGIAHACLVLASPATPGDAVTLRVLAEDLPKLSGVQVRSQSDYGAFSLVEVLRADAERLKAARVPVSEEGPRQVLGLQGREFDLSVGPPSVPPGLAASPVPGSTTFYLVHLAGPTRRAWLGEIERAGGRIVSYIPQNTYLVWIDPARIPELERAGFIKWRGLYHPGWKISAALKGARGRINYLAVVIYDPEEKTVDKIQAMGARLVRTLDSPFPQGVPGVTAVFSANASLIPKIARLPHVVYVDRMSLEPGMDDEVACQIVVGRRLNGIPYANPPYWSWLAQAGLDGSGSTVAIVDTGCDTNENDTAHLDLRGRLATVIRYQFSMDTDIAGHGTHVAGIVAGSAALGTVDDEGFLYGQGVAPAAELVIQNALATSYFPPEGGWSTLTRDSVTSGATISNNSWYSSVNPGLGYTSICATFDRLTRDADPSQPEVEPLAIVFSTGNAGPQMSTILEPKEAKNIVAVGASENYRPQAPLGGACGSSNNIDGVASFSSRGPCVDGRFAPTIVAPGTNIASAASYSATYSGGQCKAIIDPVSRDYAWMSGTSMAAPMASGALALIGQWWRTAYGSNPTPAMCKALLINGADDIAGGPDGRGGLVDHIPNGDQGWGRLNIAAAVNPPNTFFEDQTHLLTQSGQFRRYRIEVREPGKPLKITLVWSDAPGTPGAYAWANDLDLVVTGESGTYLGNVFQSGWSTVGGSRDYKNNVECVYLPQPSGVYWVTVIAANVAADGVPGNEDPLDQDFAIVIRNATVGGALLDPYSPVESATAPQPDYYRAALPGGGWSAVGLRPAPGADHDLSLYLDPGYATTPGRSVFRDSAIDFVAIDGNRPLPGMVYPAVTRYSGTSGYTIEWATRIADLAPGVAAGRSFAAADVLGIWDVEVAGPASCALRAQPDGTLDIGIAVVGSTDGAPETYLRPRSESIAQSNAGGPGSAESLLFQVPAAGRYGVVVWNEAGSGTCSVLFDSTLPTPPIVTAAPYTTDLTRLSASWSSSDPETGIARYEYAIGTSPGSGDVAGWTDAGTATQVTREGLALTAGTDYFFTVRATNGLGLANQATSGPVFAAQAVPDIAAAKALTDGTGVALTGKPVTAVFSDRFYIEEPDRRSGIGVIWSQSVPEGSLATVAGRLTTISAERFIEAVVVSAE